ncbi:hypothetical protein [Nocardia terpenica]|uniref:hypothetical protein n=1 Tax=Nocardia terpenica TaxID=455432 RepID=UPI0012E96BB5|nr:hypothetical protein [Nocardia terpenica]
MLAEDRDAIAGDGDAADALGLALGVSRAQMGELRRTLEARLGLVLGDSDIGDHSTVAALGAELSARMRAAHPLEESP